MAEKKFDHEKFQSIASVIQIGQNVQMNSNIKKLGSGMERGLDQMRSQTKAQTKTLNELTKVGKEQLDVGKESLAVGKESLAVGKEHLELQKNKDELEQEDKKIKNLAFDIKTDIDSLKGNDDPVEVLLAVGNLSENMVNNNINTQSVSDLDYKEIIANIEKDIKSLKEQSVAKLSQQDQEDLDLLYDIVAENEEGKIIEIEQKITALEMKLSAAKNRIELQEKQYEDSRKQLNNHITYQANISQMSIDEVIKKNPSHIVGCDPNLNILDNINNDELFTLASRIIGRNHKFFQSLKKNIHTNKKVGILWLFLFFPVYFYKKHKIKKMKLFGENTLRFYKFSKAEIKELKKIITEISKGELKNDAAYVERLVADQPIKLQNLEDAKKEHEGFLIKENERISGLKQKSNELKERIKWEIQNAGELLKRRPYLDSFLQGRT